MNTNVVSRADVDSQDGKRVMVRLLKHWSHRFEIDLGDSHGVVRFGDSDCEMTVTPVGLAVIIRARSEPELTDLEAVVAEHLQRMATPETLKIEWRR